MARPRNICRVYRHTLAKHWEKHVHWLGNKIKKKKSDRNIYLNLPWLVVCNSASILEPKRVGIKKKHARGSSSWLAKELIMKLMIMMTMMMVKSVVVTLMMIMMMVIRIRMVPQERERLSNVLKRAAGFFVFFLTTPKMVQTPDM